MERPMKKARRANLAGLAQTVMSGSLRSVASERLVVANVDETVDRHVWVHHAARHLAAANDAWLFVEHVS